jgi:hypothetical protein
MFKKPEIETITFEKLIQMVELPAFQRSEDESHTRDIYNFEMKHFKDYKYFLFPGVISLGIIVNRKAIILDGQHRISAIHKILLKNPEFAKETIYVSKIFGDEEYLFEIYNKINSNKKVDLILERNTADVINRTVALIKKNFKEFNSNAHKPRVPNINPDQLTQVLTNTKIVETLGIITPEDLYGKLMELNTYYSSTCTKRDFEKWEIKDLYEQANRNEKFKAKNFYLGLYNQDFEFIGRIIMKYRYDKEYFDQEHRLNLISSEDKSKESKYFDQLSSNGRQNVCCQSCKLSLTKKTFKWGMKQSFYHGGNRELDNLVVLCENCFVELGRQNFQDYMSQKSEKKSDGKQEIDLILL